MLCVIVLVYTFLHGLFIYFFIAIVFVGFVVVSGGGEVGDGGESGGGSDGVVVIGD